MAGVKRAQLRGMKLLQRRQEKIAKAVSDLGEDLTELRGEIEEDGTTPAKPEKKVKGKPADADPDDEGEGEGDDGDGDDGDDEDDLS